MQTVEGTNDLKNCTDEYVYVRWYDKIYKKIAIGEYVEKRYFTTHDIKIMYNIGSPAISRILKRDKSNRAKIRLTLKEVREFFERKA